MPRRRHLNPPWKGRYQQKEASLEIEESLQVQEDEENDEIHCRCVEGKIVEKGKSKRKRGRGKYTLPNKRRRKSEAIEIEEEFDELEDLEVSEEYESDGKAEVVDEVEEDGVLQEEVNWMPFTITSSSSSSSSDDEKDGEYLHSPSVISSSSSSSLSFSSATASTFVRGCEEEQEELSKKKGAKSKSKKKVYGAELLEKSGQEVKLRKVKVRNEKIELKKLTLQEALKVREEERRKKSNAKKKKNEAGWKRIHNLAKWTWDYHKVPSDQSKMVVKLPSRRMPTRLEIFSNYMSDEVLWKILQWRKEEILQKWLSHGHSMILSVTDMKQVFYFLLFCTLQLNFKPLDACICYLHFRK